MSVDQLHSPATEMEMDQGPICHKVEGEVVNDLDKLRATLDRGWDLNKKVAGSWYLLLWPHQSLIWWAVDYNKEDALELILSRVPEQAAMGNEAVDKLCDTLSCALKWGRRKSNETLAAMLQAQLDRLEARKRLLSVNSLSEADDFEQGRRRSVSSVSVYSHRDSSFELDEDFCQLRMDVLFTKLESLRVEQSHVAGQVENIRARASSERESTEQELESEQERLRECESNHESAVQLYQTAQEQMEIARALFESARDQFQSQRESLEMARTGLGEARSRVEGLRERKAKLDAIEQKAQESVEAMLAPVQVHCSCGKRSEERSQDQPSGGSNLECPICRDEQVSRIFQCGHALCKGCVQQVHKHTGRRAHDPKTGKVVCPICKTPVETIHPLYIV